MATVCGVGPAECSGSSNGNEGDLQTHLLMHRKSEIEHQGGCVSSNDDEKTLGGPGL